MKIFVYGTLKRGHCRNNVLQNQKFLGEVQTKPFYQLLDLGSFPGMIMGNLSVKGELYDVDENCLQQLDWIEGVPHLYKREKCKVEGHEDVQTYIYQSDDGIDCGNEWK